MNNVTRTTLLPAIAAAAALALAPAQAAASTSADYTLGEAHTLSLALTMPGGEILDLGAAAAPAPRARVANITVGSLWLGGSLGLELASGFTAFAIRVPLVYVLSEIDRNLFFDLVGHVGAAFASGGQLYELVPSARIRYQISPKVGIYGDGGFGLVIRHSSGVDVPGFGTFGGSTDLGGIVRFASGFQIGVSPNVLITIEPVGLNIYFAGGGSQFVYSLLVGALFRVG